MLEAKNLIIDPSFFAYSNAIHTLFRSRLLKEYSFVVPTLIYRTLSERKSDTFISILSRWERLSSYRIEIVWSDLMDLSRFILENSIPGVTIIEELTPYQRSVLERIDNILQIPEKINRDDFLCLEIAKEMIEIACIASLITSVSDKAKGWYQRFSRAVIKRVEDNDTLMGSKEEIRDKMQDVGWKGSVLIWLCKHIPIQFLGDAIDVVLILLTDGAYRCQNCGKSLWRLPRDIIYCPYCSKPL